jgi:hypothetical protein
MVGGEEQKVTIAHVYLTDNLLKMESEIEHTA